MRSAGEGGCGHSDWSRPGVIATPESQPREVLPGSRVTSFSRTASSLSVDKETGWSERADPSAMSEGEDTKRKPSKLAGTQP